MKWIALLIALFSFGVRSESFRFDLPDEGFYVDDSQCGGGVISKIVCRDSGAGQYYSGSYEGVSVTYIYTNPKSYQRVKLTTDKMGFDEGVYTWRVFVPNFPARDAISIGMFIYSYTHNDDRHELDFECGYGKKDDRDIVSADVNEGVCYMTSQGFPKDYDLTKIETNKWHVFSIEINNKKARWFIDGEIARKELDLGYGAEVKFLPYISVEHLSFLGENYPPNHGLTVPFDYVLYQSRPVPGLPGPLELK